jgi:hypothetical protein
VPITTASSVFGCTLAAGRLTLEQRCAQLTTSAGFLAAGLFPDAANEEGRKR